MFWKKNNFIKFNSLSLVTKLMMFYSISTIGILSAITLFLYPTFIKMVEKLNGAQASYITAECYEKIIIILLLGSLSAVLFGYFVARKGLVRVQEFEDKIEQINVNSLHEHIKIDEWPKELKSVAVKFNMMLDRIHTSFKQLSDFSSDIAHELRTPINNLRGITELALTNTKYSNDYHVLLEKYMHEYEYLSKLIENLLFLARSDHGQLLLKKQTIDAYRTIQTIYDYYQPVADEKQIKLLLEGSGALSVDPTLFKRVISNLISNAVNYTLPNGKVRVSINVDNEWIHILIQDTGIGIPDSQLGRIFDRFYRVDGSRSSLSGGLGLGLSIVKSIVELHRGKIDLRSQEKEGTSVCIKLPKL